MLSVVSEALAYLAFGLVSEWGETVPRWIPRPPKRAESGPHDWPEAWRSEVSTFLQYAALVVLFVIKQWWMAGRRD